MLQPYNITLHIYAKSEQEALELQDALRDFIIQKYNRGLYPRAESLSRVIKQYGDLPIVNNFLK